MCEASVLLAAPVALLAQGYRSIFGSDLECDTLHAAFGIPVQAGQSFDVNFALNRFNMVVVDEALLVSSASFNIVAGTLNRLNCRPVVVVAGDRRQQQPLQTVEGRVCDTISILNDQSSVWPYLSFCHELCIQHSRTKPFCLELCIEHSCTKPLRARTAVVLVAIGGLVKAHILISSHQLFNELCMEPHFHIFTPPTQ